MFRAISALLYAVRHMLTLLEVYIYVNGFNLFSGESTNFGGTGAIREEALRTRAGFGHSVLNLSF